MEMLYYKNGVVLPPHKINGLNGWKELESEVEQNEPN